MKTVANRVVAIQRMWQTEMPSRDRNPSPQLLQLRRIEKLLCAKAIHAEADALSALEREWQQSSLSRHDDAANSRLFAKHDTEGCGLEQPRVHNPPTLSRQCEREKNTMNNREFVIDVRKKEVKHVYSTATSP
jgi:hypothetical protein